MSRLVRFVSPNALILLVFCLTSLTLILSVNRDLRQSPDIIEDWKMHVKGLLSNASAPGWHSLLLKDAKAAMAVVLRSEVSVFLMVQFCFSAYSVFALATIVGIWRTLCPVHELLMIVSHARKRLMAHGICYYWLLMSHSQLLPCHFKVLFLGRLSTWEVSRLTERLIKYVLFKVVFCSALIVPDVYEIVMWMTWFAMIGFMRVFLGAAKDRLDSLSQAPNASTFAHLRTLALVMIILGNDLAGVVAVISSSDGMTISKILLCAFDMGIVFVEGVKTLLHYAVALWDRSVAMRRDLPEAEERAGADASEGGGGLTGRWEAWEGKGSLLLHMDLVADILVHGMTLAHYVHIWCLHGLTFQLIDAILFLDIRFILLALVKRIRLYLAYRQATHSLRHAFPDAAADHEQCAICMERMTSAKQLPCGHLFHLGCLRAWLQQSGSESFACPLCRKPLMRGGSGGTGGGGRQQRRVPRPAFVEAVLVLMSWVYLDVALAVLLDLPISSLALHQRRHGSNTVAAATGSGRRRTAGGAGSRARASGRALFEEVDESGSPVPGAEAAPTVAAAAAATGGWRGWFSRRRGRAGAGSPGGSADVRAEAAARLLLELAGDDDSVSDDGLTTGSDEDGFGGLFDSGDDEGPDQPGAEDSSRHYSNLLGRRRAWGGQTPADGVWEDLAGPSRAAAAALHPPPYDPESGFLDPPAWSSEFVAQRVARSLHSSLGMGERENRRGW